MASNQATIEVRIPFAQIQRKQIATAERALDIVAEDWHREAVNTFSEHTNTGGSKRSIDVQRHGLEVRLTATGAQMATLHFGRGKNRRFPPPDVIKKWLRRRLGLSPDEAEDRAFVTARAIAKRGMWPGKGGAGSKYATLGPGGTYGLNFAAGPLKKKGKKGGEWVKGVARILREANS